MARRERWRLRCRRRQRRVVAQDRLLELAQLDRRLDPELLHERPSRGLVGGERVRLPARPVQRQHQLAAQPLPVGVLAHQPLEIANHLRLPAERQLRLDPPLDRADVQLFQAGDLRLRERVVPKVAQRRPPPQRQRLAQPPGPEPQSPAEIAARPSSASRSNRSRSSSPSATRIR